MFNHVRGFVNFIREQGVVGLAVGLVLGGAVTTVVKSLIDNIVMPPIGFLLGSANGIKGLSWTLGSSMGQPVVLQYGTFINDMINFMVIAAVVYFTVHLLGLDKKFDKKKYEP
jgi:large conductance mechanosensitive channel